MEQSPIYLSDFFSIHVGNAASPNNFIKTVVVQLGMKVCLRIQFAYILLSKKPMFRDLDWKN